MVTQIQIWKKRRPAIRPHETPEATPCPSARRAGLIRVAIAFLALASLSLPAKSAETFTLQTGRGQVLQRLTTALPAPGNAPSASLRFEFAFATQERLIPGEFLDSFTVTLRTTNRSHTLTLLTADRFGVTWAPGSTPANLIDPARDLHIGPSLLAPGSLGNPDLTAVHSVLLQLPAPFRTQPSQLILSLFDNEDAEGSQAVLTGISVRAGNPATITVESSAAPEGRYAREDGARIDPLLQTITVDRGGVRRFYRLKGETGSRVTRLQRTASALALDYEKEIGQPTLQAVGSNQPDGPFTPVLNATFDLTARKVFIPLFNAPGFLRVTGSHPVRIINDVVTGNQRILDYQVFPIPPGVESSAEVSGPYAAEIGVIEDPFSRRLRLPGGGVARFYRVKADVPLILRETVLNGDEVILRYDVP